MPLQLLKYRECISLFFIVERELRIYMAKTIKGFDVNDIEKPMREVLLVLANAFNYPDELRGSANNLELSYTLARGSGAQIAINKKLSDQPVYTKFEGVDGGYGCFKFYHFLNNPSGVVDDILSKWRDVREKEPAFCNGMKNCLNINPFPYSPIGYSHVNKIFSVLDLGTKINLKRIKMAGLCEDFSSFYSLYINRRHYSDMNPIIAGSASSASDKEIVSKLLLKMTENYGLTFVNSKTMDLKSFFGDKDRRKFFSDDFIEQVYADMLKSSSNKYSSEYLYKDLKDLIDVSNLKTKTFRDFMNVRSLGDESKMIADDLPDGFDSFFLSKLFAEKAFNFNSTTSNNFLTEAEITKNANFFFNMMSTSTVQPLSGILSAKVENIKGFLHCVLDVNTKYKRENMVVFAKEFLGKIDELSRERPFPSKDMNIVFSARTKREANYDDYKFYINNLDDFVKSKKLKNKIEKNMDKVMGANIQNKMGDDEPEETSTISFRI